MVLLMSVFPFVLCEEREDPTLPGAPAVPTRSVPQVVRDSSGRLLCLVGKFHATVFSCLWVCDQFSTESPSQTTDGFWYHIARTSCTLFIAEQLRNLVGCRSRSSMQE